VHAAAVGDLMRVNLQNPRAAGRFIHREQEDQQDK
jgi:hypothetical protein